MSPTASLGPPGSDAGASRQLLSEFNEKKKFSSIREAYPNRREAVKMYKKFKQEGLIQKSWKRSCGMLKTADPSYRKQWRARNRDKVLRHTQKWITKLTQRVDQGMT